MKHIELFENFSGSDMKNMLDEGAIKWTPEKIRQEITSGNYKSQKDLKEKNPGLYAVAYRNKMLDEFFDPNKWTPEKIRQAIKDGGYARKKDLRDKNLNLYQAALRNKMLGEFFDEQGNKR
jgi:hypothetical protein